MRPTASSAALLHACAYSFRPDVALPVEPPSDAATRGTVFGSLAEGYINGSSSVGPTAKAIDLPPDEELALSHMWEHALAWLKANARAGWVAERAFAYDPATDVGRELPRIEHRDYSGATPGEVCGTADLVWIDGESVVIADWKTTSPGAPEVDATAQLEWLALFAARAWGYDSARIVTLKVTEVGVEVIEGEPLDMFGLAAIAERIAADVARIPGAETHGGDHCRGRYCKALTSCPETTSLIEQLIPADALARKEWRFTPQIESPDHLQRILVMKPIVTEYLERVNKAIAAYVADGEVTTSDGVVIKQTYRTMPRLDHGELVALVKSLGGSQEMIDACVHPKVEGAGVKASKPKALKRGRAA